MGGSAGAYPGQITGTAADFSGKCSEGQFHPVETGINAWSFVPATEADLERAVSRVPAKVSVDAALLQTYRAGFIGCNALSRVANHAMMAVGYNFQTFPRPAAPWDAPAAVELHQGCRLLDAEEFLGHPRQCGRVCVPGQGCAEAAPLGLMLNRGDSSVEPNGLISGWAGCSVNRTPR